MSSRRLPLALLLLAPLQIGCPAQPAPPQPPLEIDAPDEPEPRAPEPHAPEPRAPEPHRPGAPTTTPAPTDERPAFSTPKGEDSLADTLPAPSPSSGLPGTCEGGTRRPGETWKVDCNECSCGDDGQSRCTVMACLPRPVR